MTLLPRSAVRSRLPVAAALLAWASGASGASFGVPPGPGEDPSGYFILVAPDAVNDTVSVALGDVARFVTLAIENHATGLVVDLYDPGLYNPALGPGQLDLNLGSPPATPAGIEYSLFGPDGSGMLHVLLARQVFLGDTAATDRQLVRFFDDAGAEPGLYHLVARMLDGPAQEQDIAVFGVSVPGRSVSALGLTVGRADEDGASVAEPLRLFPHVVTPDAGSDGLGPVCGLQFVTYDLDAARNGDEPPFVQLSTPGGFTFPTDGASGDARWWATDLGGVNPGDLDSSDHGPWTWSFSGLMQPEDCFGNLSPSIDLNAFGAQVLDYAAPPRDFASWADLPDGPPFIVFNADRPRRIYLPDDDGGAPPKETLNHRAIVVEGYPSPALGEASTLEIVLSLDNPSPHALTSVSGRTHVSPNPDVTDPVLLAATGGLVAVVDPGDPRRIDFSGSVPAGGRGEIRYQVMLTPSALGPAFLTGDGSGYVSATRPTLAAWLTPFTHPASQVLPAEAQGPLCDLAYEARLPECTVRAVLDASTLRTCPGTPVRLDASASEVFACPGGVAAYQWRVNGAIIHPFPAAGAIDVTPLLNDTWEVTVACSTDPAACFDAASVTFDLYPAPLVALGADRVACAGDVVDLAAIVSDGSPPYANSRWSTVPPGLPGDGTVGDTLRVTATEDATYVFHVDDAQGCTGTASVAVDVRSPDPQVLPDPPLLCEGGTVEVAAAAGFASYSWSTLPAGASGDGSSDATVTADSSGVTYTVVVTDDAGCQGSQAVTTQATADPVPGPMNWSLRVSKSGVSDIRHSWQDLPDPAGGYQVLWFPCDDADMDGACDAPPTRAALASSPSFVIVPPGAEESIEPGGQDRSPPLVFSKVRALSPCSASPGEFAP